MYDEIDGIPLDFWSRITRKEIQKERKVLLYLYSEESLEYIWERLHEIEQICAELDITID